MTVDEVEAIAKLFKDHDKDYVRGGFGHISKKVVQSWAHEDSLELVWRRDDKRIVAAAHVNYPKTTRRIKDFAGTVCGTVLKCDRYIKRAAFVDGEGLAKLAHRLYDDNAARTIWVEEFIEYRDDLIDFGFVHVCTKIRGDSTMMGVFAWCPSTSNRFEQSHGADEVTLEQLDLKVPHALIDNLYQAMEREGLDWANHYSHYNVKNTWSAVTLRGYGGLQDFIIKPSEMSKKWKSENEEKLDWAIEDTPMREKLPEIEPLVELIPAKKHRIRLMRLQAGSELLRHADITDPDAGTADGKLLRIHLPIDTNPDCWVHQWTLDGKKKSRHMLDGQAWYLDTRKPHSVQNGGDTDRIHLVMDVESNKELRALLGIEEDDQPQIEEWI